MTNAINVTAIMAAYNAEQHIGEAIESVISQHYPHWELIIVDDGSTDRTRAVAEQFADPRIKVLHLDENRGRGAASNVALAQAKGRYIAPCDADDISLPHRFSTEVAFLDEHPDIDVVGSQLLYFTAEEPPRIWTLYPESPEAIHRRFARGKMAAPHGGAMIRRSCFERFGAYRDEFRMAQDFEFYLRVHRHCRFQVLSDPLMMYRSAGPRTPLAKVRANASWDRYARYLLHSDEGSRLSFDEFARKPSVWLASNVLEPVAFYRRRLLNAVSQRSLS